jgi:putative ABC transport system permease protein
MCSWIISIHLCPDPINKRVARNFVVTSRDINEEVAKPYRIFNEADILKQLNWLANALEFPSCCGFDILNCQVNRSNEYYVYDRDWTHQGNPDHESSWLFQYGYSLAFLVESVIISLFGGLLGLELGIVGDSHMKITVFSRNHKGREGNIHIMVEEFLKGAEEAGA